jgi:hypothetical protein
MTADVWPLTASPHGSPLSLKKKSTEKKTSLCLRVFVANLVGNRREQVRMQQRLEPLIIRLKVKLQV